MFGLAVRKGQLDIIKYLVTECSVSVNGEQSVYVSPAICGARVCEHMYNYSTLIYNYSTSTQVFTLSHTHLLQTDPTLSRHILELSIHRGDLDFIKYLVNKLSVDVNGELSNIKSVIHS